LNWKLVFAIVTALFIWSFGRDIAKAIFPSSEERLPYRDGPLACELNADDGAKTTYAIWRIVGGKQEKVTTCELTAKMAERTRDIYTKNNRRNNDGVRFELRLEV
jgi:hypothetical protein